jgi:D-lactate dehydrogenase
MKLAVFSTKAYDRSFLSAANAAAGHRHEIEFFETHLDVSTAALANGAQAICAFVNDHVDQPTLDALFRQGTRLVALRCAGFNNVDLAAALILGLNRKTHRAYARVREGNFALEGLLGFDLHGRTVGLIGLGRIGLVFARIMNGFGCRLLAYDPIQTDEFKGLGGQYVELEKLLSASDIISLHCPLTPETRHLVNAGSIQRMRPGVMLVNTSRGAVIDTKAVIDGLKSGIIGYLGLDVYEEEGDLFFENLSEHVIQDDIFARLLTFPNVLITGHQAFFTREALQAIAETTIANVSAFESIGKPVHLVTVESFVCSARRGA